MTNSQRMRDSAVMMSSTMPSAKYSCSGSPLMFWNGKHRDRRLVRQRQRRCGGRMRLAASACAHPVDAHRPGDVLDLLFAQILEDEAAACRATWSCTVSETQIPPGSASASSRAAMLTPSP